jgi:hypothetical protein
MELTEESANNNREHRLFGPAYSSDDAGDGPTITTTPSLLIFLGKRHLNVPLKISVQEGKLYVRGIEADGSMDIYYYLKLLRYSEKGKDTLLEGDGLRLIADQTTMRRLFSKVSGRIKIERGPKSTITIMPSFIEFHGKKHPNYPISITLEGGAFYLESILLEERNWSLRGMRQKVIGTDWEIKVEGLTFCADKTELKKWVDSYKEQVETRSKARAQETAPVEVHKTPTKEIIEASPTPEKASGGREKADDWPRTAAGILMTPVNWGAITPDRVREKVDELAVVSSSKTPPPHGCVTPQDSFLRRQLNHPRMKQTRRRRGVKVEAIEAATAAVDEMEAAECEAAVDETKTAELEAAVDEMEAAEREAALDEMEAVEREAAVNEMETAEREVAVDIEAVKTKEPNAELMLAEGDETKAEHGEDADGTRLVVGIDLSTVDLDKVKKHLALYRKQDINNWTFQSRGQARQRKKKSQTQHPVTLRKEKRPKSVFTEWSRAINTRVWRCYTKDYRINGKDREETANRLKIHASQLWQDSVFQRRTGPAGARWNRWQEKRTLEINNYIVAKLILANKTPAFIACVTSALADKRFPHHSVLKPNFLSSIGGVT